MKKSKILKFFIYFIIITIISIFSFLLNFGYQFGKATSEASKHIIEVRNEWKEKNINPIDTIVRDIYKALDSTNNIKLKK